MLVCTNGVTDSVDEEAIAEVLGSGKSPDELSAALVDRAADSAGHDDATAVVACYRIPG